MKYHPNVIYHVYNQSINYERIYYDHGNYQFFRRKIRTHILPYADIMCYCLMPDHFHLMLKPKEAGCEPSRGGRFLRHNEPGTDPVFQQNLSHGIKIALSSYTRALNARRRRRGSLFRSKTKAKPAYANFYPDEVELTDPQPFTRFLPYLKVCFHYIHDNPVKAKLVSHPLEYPYSSALAYAGWQEDDLINFELANHLLGIAREPDKQGPHPIRA